MDDRVITKGLLTAAECAQRTGLTVRSLRLYEQYGLLAPIRTGKNWRLYGERELARLNEVLALKQLGLSLGAMARLLAGQETDMARLLDLQKDALTERRERAERGLKTVFALRAKLEAGGAVSLGDLMDLAKETNMSDASTETVAWRRYEQARPRTAVPIDPSLYADYGGCFESESGFAIAIAAREDRLFARVIGQMELEIFPEAPDRFFYKTPLAQIEFVRDGRGAVRGIVLHQYGCLFPCARIEEARFKAIEAALAQKVANNAPYPGGAEMVAKIITDGQNGQVSDALGPALVAISTEQRPMLDAMFARLGALRGVSFTRVDAIGLDHYEAAFENGALEVMFMLGADGKARGFGLRQLR